MTWAEGGSIEDILKAFTVGFATGVLIHGVGKALGKMKFCFVAGTVVLMAGGAVKCIEDVRVGDKVKSYNPATGKVSEKRVLQTFENEVDELVTVSTSDGQQVTATPGHKFYANNDWVSAEDLRAGDVLVNVNGEKVIVEQVQHELLDSPVKVYNFEVADNHTYFVGNGDGMAVHNAACSKKPTNSSGVKSVKNPIEDIKYTSKVEGQMLEDIRHGFPSMIDDIAAQSGKVGKIVGDDGVERIIVELPGAINGESGVFQWIIDSNSLCNHRLFVTNIKKIFLF